MLDSHLLACPGCTSAQRRSRSTSTWTTRLCSSRPRWRRQVLYVLLFGSGCAGHGALTTHHPHLSTYVPGPVGKNRLASRVHEAATKEREQPAVMEVTPEEAERIQVGG